MTLARIFATGSGTLSVRIVIEGLEVEFVSDPAMEKTTDDGRRRVYCLAPMAEGFTIEDKVNIPEAVLEAMGTGLRVYETEDEDISRVFHCAPEVEIPIEVTIEEADTSVFLLSATGLSEGDVVHVGTEAMLINSIDGTALSVTRGYWDTIPQKHWSNDTANDIPYRTLYDRPFSVRGRRLYVHLYGDGDDLQGDGTQVWIGHVKSDPACIPSDDGLWWRLSVGSIADRLKSKLGGELAQPCKPRGIYYHDFAALHIVLYENGTPSEVIRFVGFYETQRAFCDALTAALASAATAASFTSTYRAVESPSGDGTWTIEVAVGSSVTSVRVWAESAQDGQTMTDDGVLVDADGANAYPLTVGERVYPVWRDAFSGVDADLGRRRVPRGHLGRADSFFWEPGGGFPDDRVFVDEPVSTDWTAVLIEKDSASTTQEVDATSVASGWIEIDIAVIGTGGAGSTYLGPFGGHNVPTLAPARLLARGTVAAFRDALVEEGPEYANRGTAPFLTTADLASWTGVASEAAGGELVRQRLWTLATTVEVDEVLSHELRLLGAFPIIDADGKIAIARLDTPNPSSVDATTIDDEIVSVGWSTMERGGQTINRVELHLGYNPREDEWTHYIEVKDAESYAQNHEDRVLEIKPRSTALAGDDQVEPRHVARVAGATLGLFGYAHDFVTVNVSWKLFGLLLGSFVSFSAEHLPDFTTGRRPVSAALGIVVGRKWELGKAYGTLTLLMPRLRIGGYAPTARVLSASGGEDNKWTLTVDHELYAPRDEATGAIRRNTDAFFETFDRVVIREWDSESPTTQTGFVTSVDVVNHNILVQFDGSWTPGSSIWELSYQNHASVQESQKRFAFIADTGGLLGGAPARRFAP